MCGGVFSELDIYFLVLHDTQVFCHVIVVTCKEHLNYSVFHLKACTFSLSACCVLKAFNNWHTMELASMVDSLRKQNNSCVISNDSSEVYICIVLFCNY